MMELGQGECSSLPAETTVVSQGLGAQDASGVERERGHWESGMPSPVLDKIDL